MGDDADAIWRPGFAGEVVYPQPAVAPPSPEARVPEPSVQLDDVDERAPTAPPPGRGRMSPPRRLLELGAVAVVAVVAVVALTRSGGGHGSDSSAVGRIPAAATERWTATLPGQITSVLGTGHIVLATSADDRTTLSALDRRSGAHIWTRSLAPLQIDDVSVVDGIVVCATRRNGVRFGDRLVGLDGRSGEERWRSPLADNVEALMDGRHVVVPRVDDHYPALIGVALIDPRTGSASRSIEGDDVALTGDHVQARDGDTFRLYDVDTFERTAVVTLPALHGVAARIVPTPSGPLAVTSSRAMLFDRRGRLASSVRLGPPIGDYVPFAWDLHGIVVVQTGEAVTALSVTGERVRIGWTRRGDLLDRAGEADRALLAVVPPDGRAGLTSARPVAVWRAATGAIVWSGTVPARPDGFEVLTGNGLVAEQATGDSFRRAIAGIGLDGAVLWRHVVRRGGDTALIDGAMVELGPTPGRDDQSTLTLLG